jgi:hypothetical protein
MKDKLLSDYFPKYISSTVWDSDNLIPLNHFEYLESIEELCLSEFLVFKQIFDQLELIDKNEVIKFWNIHSKSKFDEYLRFCPENFNNFDPEEFFGDDYSSYIHGTKVFHLRHYVEKFKFLIRCFLVCEEEYLKKRTLNTIAQKQEFNPIEILKLKVSEEAFVKTKKQDLLIDVSQKNKGHLFCLFKELKIKAYTHKNTVDYCKELCIEYSTRYSDQIRQNFNLTIHKTYRETFKEKVVSLLPEDQKSIIEQYFNSIEGK